MHNENQRIHVINKTECIMDSKLRHLPQTMEKYIFQKIFQIEVTEILHSYSNMKAV